MILNTGGIRVDIVRISIQIPDYAVIMWTFDWFSVEVRLQRIDITNWYIWVPFGGIPI